MSKEDLLVILEKRLEQSGWCLASQKDLILTKAKFLDEEQLGLFLARLRIFFSRSNRCQNQSECLTTQKIHGQLINLIKKYVDTGESSSNL